jgi:hypothetical protein
MQIHTGCGISSKQVYIYQHVSIAYGLRKCYIDVNSDGKCDGADPDADIRKG